VSDPTREIACGQRVRVRWEDQEGGAVSLPLFAPV
jgi:hypothetical protein